MKKNKKIKPTTLILYPTKRCNSRCPHCFWVSRSKSCFDTSDAMDMPFDKVKEIIDHYRKKGVKRIRIQSEGEILLYKHFKETVLYCRQRGFLKFGIPTNGILLDEYTDFILDNMNQLTVSIDGYDSKSYIEHRGGTEGTYKKILNNITDFVKKRKNNKCKIMINSVIHSGNFDKSVRFVELAESLGVDAIRFSNFHPIGKEETLKPVSIKDIKHLAKYFSRRKNLIKVKTIKLPPKKGPFFCSMLFSTAIVGSRYEMSPCCRIGTSEKWGKFSFDAKQNSHNSKSLCSLRDTFIKANKVADLDAVCRMCSRLKSK